MKPITRTHDGASVYLNYDRLRKLVRISVDRWPVQDGTPAQCDAIRELAIREWTGFVTLQLGGRQNTAFLDSPSIWEFWTTAARERTVLAEINRIEQEVSW